MPQPLVHPPPAAFLESISAAMVPARGEKRWQAKKGNICQHVASNKDPNHGRQPSIMVSNACYTLGLELVCGPSLSYRLIWCLRLKMHFGLLRPSLSSHAILGLGLLSCNLEQQGFMLYM